MTAYGTTAQLIARIQVDSGDITAAQEATLDALLEAISRKIDNFTRRPSGYIAEVAPSTKYLIGSGKSWMRIPECIAISTVAVKASYTDTDYVDWETATSTYAGDGDWMPARGTYQHPIFDKTPYTMLVIDPNGDYSVFYKSYGIPNIQVSARWGYAAEVPSDIREACLAQVTILWKRFQGSMATTLGSQDLGTIAARIRDAAFTRDVKELLIDSGWVLPLYGGQQ